MLLTHLPIVLLPRRQLRKGCSEMALRIAVKAALTAKALPLPEQGQGDHLTPAQGRLGTWVWRGGQREHAKVIDQNVKSGQEGVHINHRSAPYFEDRAILPAGGTFCVSLSYQLTPSVQKSLPTHTHDQAAIGAEADSADWAQMRHAGDFLARGTFPDSHRVIRATPKKSRPTPTATHKQAAIGAEADNV